MTLPFTLARPLIVFDLETTGNVPERDRICQIAIIRYKPDGSVREWSSLVNPTIPIPPAATEVHGITDAMVADKPTFAQLAANLSVGFAHTDFCGYNVRFDLRVLAAEFKRLSMPFSYAGANIVDPVRLWQIINPRTLADAVREFCDREPTAAHNAVGDAIDARDALLGQLTKRPSLPRDLNALHRLSWPDYIDAEGKLRWQNGEAVIAFGKHKGVALRNLPRDYISWVLRSDFPDDMKAILRDAARGVYPSHQPQEQHDDEPVPSVD